MSHVNFFSRVLLYVMLATVEVAEPCMSFSDTYAYVIIL